MQTLGLLGPGASLSFPYIFKNTLEKNLGYSLDMFAKFPSRVALLFFAPVCSKYPNSRERRESKIKNSVSEEKKGEIIGERGMRTQKSQ